MSAEWAKRLELRRADWHWQPVRCCSTCQGSDLSWPPRPEQGAVRRNQARPRR